MRVVVDMRTGTPQIVYRRDLTEQGWPMDRQILAFLTNEIGNALARNGDKEGAGRTFSEAIDIDSRTAPAYLNLGDVREQQGNVAAAVEAN